MVQEYTDTNSIAQATEIGQLLTPYGIKYNDIINPWFGMKEVSPEQGSFFGKEKTLSEIQERLKDDGIAVIEGGSRSGKSSLLLTVCEQMEKSEAAHMLVVYSLDRFPASKTVEKIEEKLKEDVGNLSSNSGRHAVIAFDEIEGLKLPEQVKFLDLIRQMKAKGHYIIFAVHGDLSGDGQKELPRQTKDSILQMIGNKPVINRLMDDEEMRQLLAHGNEPFFSEAMTKYIIAEAGGHPFVANILAGTIFELIKINQVEPVRLIQALKKEMSNRLDGVDFGWTVKNIVAAGFDPLTWEWHGDGNKPDVEVYQNMLPRFTSTIFRDWLRNYLRKPNEI